MRLVSERAGKERGGRGESGERGERERRERRERKERENTGEKERVEMGGRRGGWAGRRASYVDMNPSTR